MHDPIVYGHTKAGSRVRALDFVAFGSGRYGTAIAAADYDSDVRDELIVGHGAGPGLKAHVRGYFFSFQTSAFAPQPGLDFYAYGAPNWGVNITTGDIDNDGLDEIVTGAGCGPVYGPHVRAFKWDQPTQTLSRVQDFDFIAYGTRKFGVKAACADLDGDGYDEIITSPGPGRVFGPHIRGWNYDDNAGGKGASPISNISFFAYNRVLKYGANVTGTDIDQDGFNEIITGPGPGSNYGSHFRAFNYDNSHVTSIGKYNYFAYTSKYGLNVAPNGLEY
jgi:hypothetical protein